MSNWSPKGGAYSVSGSFGPPVSLAGRCVHLHGVLQELRSLRFPDVRKVFEHALGVRLSILEAPTEDVPGDMFKEDSLTSLLINDELLMASKDSDGVVLLPEMYVGDKIELQFVAPLRPGVFGRVGYVFLVEPSGLRKSAQEQEVLIQRIRKKLRGRGTRR